jgi:serine/threonine protein kinase
MRKNSYQKKTLLGYNPNTKRRIIGTPDYIPPEIIKQ